MTKVLLSNALYKGGVWPGKKLHPYGLRVLTRHIIAKQDQSTLLSLACANALSGEKIFRISEVGPQGVTVNGQIVKPHFIKIRTYEGAKRVYVTEDEMSRMTEFWGLPTVVIEQAYFLIKDTQGYAFRKNLEISPAWQELLDPQWHAAFTAWLSGRGPLPEVATVISPSLPDWTELPDAQWKKAFSKMVRSAGEKNILPGLPWITMSREKISFPAIDPVCAYKMNVRTRLTRGQMEFSEFQGARFARFTAPAYGSTLFAISSDSVRHCGNHSQDEDYKKARLVELIARGKTSGEYCFSLQARKKGISSLGLIQGLQITLSGSVVDGIRLQEGQLYYFIAERIDQDTVRISCYLDAGRKKLHGYLQTGLRYGGFEHEHLTLRGASSLGCQQ